MDLEPAIAAQIDFVLPDKSKLIKAQTKAQVAMLAQMRKKHQFDKDKYLKLLVENEFKYSTYICATIDALSCFALFEQGEQIRWPDLSKSFTPEDKSHIKTMLTLINFIAFKAIQIKDAFKDAAKISLPNIRFTEREITPLQLSEWKVYCISYLYDLKVTHIILTDSLKTNVVVLWDKNNKFTHNNFVEVAEMLEMFNPD